MKEVKKEVNRQISCLVGGFILVMSQIGLTALPSPDLGFSWKPDKDSLIVKTIRPLSAAARGKFQPGDVIQSINGVEIGSRSRIFPVTAMWPEAPIQRFDNEIQKLPVNFRVEVIVEREMPGECRPGCNKKHDPHDFGGIKQFLLFLSILNEADQIIQKDGQVPGRIDLIPAQSLSLHVEGPTSQDLIRNAHESERDRKLGLRRKFEATGRERQDANEPDELRARLEALYTRLLPQLKALPGYFASRREINYGPSKSDSMKMRIIVCLKDGFDPRQHQYPVVMENIPIEVKSWDQFKMVYHLDDEELFDHKIQESDVIVMGIVRGIKLIEKGNVEETTPNKGGPDGVDRRVRRWENWGGNIEIIEILKGKPRLREGKIPIWWSIHDIDENDQGLKNGQAGVWILGWAHRLDAYSLFGGVSEHNAVVDQVVLKARVLRRMAELNLVEHGKPEKTKISDTAKSVMGGAEVIVEGRIRVISTMDIPPSSVDYLFQIDRTLKGEVNGKELRLFSYKPGWVDPPRLFNQEWDAPVVMCLKWNRGLWSPVLGWDRAQECIFSGAQAEDIKEFLYKKELLQHRGDSMNKKEK